MDKLISIFGSSGFIGSKFCNLYSNQCVSIPKQTNITQTKDILYFISTVDNYNVYDNPYIDIETNLIKLISVLEECKKKSKENIVFNFVSSWFVYGKIDNPPASETTYCNPTGFYSITKYAAEKMLISYCQTFGMNYRILRLTNIIGKNDKKVSKKKNALQHMIQSLKEHEPISLYDNGSNIRDFMDVEDCCRAIKHCLDHSPLNSIINISNNEPKSIGEIIDYVKRKTNSQSNIIHIPAPDFHKIVQIKDMWLNNKKLLSYGYIPQINVFEAIDHILDS